MTNFATNHTFQSKLRDYIGKYKSLLPIFPFRKAQQYGCRLNQLFRGKSKRIIVKLNVSKKKKKSMSCNLPIKHIMISSQNWSKQCTRNLLSTEMSHLPPSLLRGSSHMGLMPCLNSEQSQPMPNLEANSMWLYNAQKSSTVEKVVT